MTVGEVSDSDRELARGLPDEFLNRVGVPVDRVVGLVSAHWESHDNPACAELAQVLLPILGDLLQPWGLRHRRAP